ncbi:MAG: hypothetical protein O6929_02945 [candidate division NC10 bacterium]|nr:hypothetical protein [candidate division NC10 bacterium]
MRKAIYLILGSLVLYSCINIIVHDEKKAASKAKEFAEAAFINGNIEVGYSLLSERTKSSLSSERFREIIERMHPDSTPITINSMEYEPIPGQKAMNIYLLAKKNNEEFYYRLLMVGTKDSGYKVERFLRGKGPYPSSNLRKKIG